MKSLTTIIFLFVLFYNTKGLPSLGCGKPIEVNENSFSKVFTYEINDPLLGLVDREIIVQFPAGYDNQTPLPMVFDVHGYQGSAYAQQASTGWSLMGEQENFLVVWPNGMADEPNGWYTSWNVSKTFRPKGFTCDTSITTAKCYYSCPECKNDGTSCDWSSCYDDVYFFQWILDNLTDTFCIDLNQLHYSGYSNGGMLAWYIASTTTDALGFATINTVAASSLNGYGIPPEDPINFSIIDFHGFEDTVIPYNTSFGNGIGPENTVIGFSGYYWDQKPELLKAWNEKLQCLENEIYVTPYDGQYNFQCLEAKCSNQKSIVQCTGDFGHAYPLPFDVNVATEVAYQFMKNHPRQ